MNDKWRKRGGKGASLDAGGEGTSLYKGRDYGWNEIFIWTLLGEQVEKGGKIRLKMWPLQKFMHTSVVHLGFVLL